MDPKAESFSQSRFTDKQKDYLIAKFETGEQTGQKADAASVSRLMRSEKNENGELLFDCSESLKSLKFVRSAEKVICCLEQ